MKIINADVEFITPIDGAAILKRLEQCGRVCYKSEAKITDTSAPAFVAGIIKRGHEAVLEHCSFTVKFICDRGVSHEIVRHRMASYCQESTRYCNYSKDGFGNEITVIEPCFWDKNSLAGKVKMDLEMSRNVQSGNTQNLKSSAAPVRLPAAPASTPGTSQAVAQAGCVYRP